MRSGNVAGVVGRGGGRGAFLGCSNDAPIGVPGVVGRGGAARCTLMVPALVLIEGGAGRAGATLVDSSGDFGLSLLGVNFL